MKPFLQRQIPLLAALFCLAFPVRAQQYFRLSADIQIKENTGETQSLVMGRVFYDMNIKKIVYQIRFPSVETWVLHDSTMYKFRNDSLVLTRKISPVAEATLFHLLLNGQLQDFGITDEVLTLDKVVKKDSLVISTYKPVAQLAKLIGRIELARKQDRLSAVVMYNPEMEMVGKQVFGKYFMAEGLAVPGEVIQVTYPEKPKPGEQEKKKKQEPEVKPAPSDEIQLGNMQIKHEIYRKTELSHVILNETQNQHLYDYPLPR